MRKKSIVVAALILLICMTTCSLPVCAAPKPPAVRNVIESDEEGIADISPYKGVFYLPAGVDITRVRFDTSATGFTYYGGSGLQPFPEDHILDLTPGETVDTYGNTCYKITLSAGSVYTFYTAGSVGTVYVATSRGKNYISFNKENRDKETKLIITDAGGNVIYNDEAGDTLSEIKGRGNASYSNEKKPFQIKLGKKTDLFGMGKAKTWILLANYNDASYMRNTCAFTIADALEMPYTPKSVFVNLYIDNEYQGIYQLSEKTQIGNNRIEITDLEEINETTNSKLNLDSLGLANGSGDYASYRYADGMTDPKNITGGYLVELDNLYSEREKCIFKTGNGNTYTVKSPEVSSKNEMEYISDLFGRFEQALYSETGYNDEGVYYTEYCDLESLVKVYVVEEITKNWDAYIGSIFFYKDVDKNGETSKIYAGPVWDFDNTWGNIRGRGTFADDITEIWADGDNNNGGFSYKQDFGAALMQHEDAKALAAEYYAKAAFCVEEMLAEGGLIETLTETLSQSAHMDMARWPIARRSNTFIYFNHYEGDAVDTAVGYLRNFMAVRTEALYEAFGAERIEHTDPPEETDASETLPEETATDTDAPDETASATEPPDTGGETAPDTAARDTDAENVTQTEAAGKIRPYIKYIAIGVSVLVVIVLAAAMIKKKK